MKNAIRENVFKISQQERLSKTDSIFVSRMEYLIVAKYSAEVGDSELK